jgi:hypothetical protein
VVHATPDGHTLLLVTASNAINISVYDKLNFNFIRDIVPVAGIVRLPNVLVVHTSFPATSVPEFIAFAKANPNRINMASAGTGSPSHLAGELFKMMTGVMMVHVPYRGGAPAIADLLAGQVQVQFDALPTSIEHIKAGKLRALAVTTAARSPALPDIPTLGEFARPPARRRRNCRASGISDRPAGAPWQTRSNDTPVAAGSVACAERPNGVIFFTVSASRYLDPPSPFSNGTKA